MAQKARTKSLQLKGMEFADQLAQSMLDHATTMEKTYQDLKTALAADPPSDKKIKNIILDVESKQKWFDKAEVGGVEKLLRLMVFKRCEKQLNYHFQKFQIQCNLYIYIWVFPKIGVPPNHFFNMVFNIYHPFWGTPVFGNTHMKNLRREGANLGNCYWWWTPWGICQRDLEGWWWQEGQTFQGCG